ncbi:MAG: hypothetical protein H6728_10275 [Myxococcales bacterium]|nr:hypothetical protein [Myxococcales bacterium]MCB9643445.1 hypothetical protein [Myxococcales bacterium]
MRNILYVALLFVGSLSWMTDVRAEQDVVQRVAKWYGVGTFGSVQRLSYTFHVQKGTKQGQRTWVWEPQLHRVSFRSGPKQPWFRYVRGSEAFKSSPQAQKIDRWFINDQYWLLFPFHVVWDKGTQVTTEVAPKTVTWGTHTFQPTHIISVRYPNQGGYTPGDLYKLYVSKEGALVAWSYHRGGSVKPTRQTTWEKHIRAGSLRLSTLHRGVGGAFRIWFSGVSVE